MTQDKKRAIAAALHRVLPVGWKYSLSVRNHSTITMQINAAPFDLIKAVAASEYFDPTTATSCEINPYHVRARFVDECVADVFEVIFGALNTGNHDRSDPTTDYFDVGHYVTLRIGAWNRPFAFTA